MKKINIIKTIVFFNLFLLVSCSKNEIPSVSPSNNKSLAVNVAECNPGYHWDYYLMTCVPVCGSGYHNDSITGACIINGGSSGTLVVITNSNNPYDNTGVQHNNGVNSILPNINLATNNTDSVVFVNVKSYVSGIGYNADSIQNFYNREVQAGYFPYSKLPELDSLGNLLYSNGILSSYGNSYVQQMYSYALQYLNTNTINTTNYNLFANAFVTLESTINNDARISSWEKQVLLSACSVGRYSGSYWGNYLNQGSTSSSIAQLSLKLKLPKWLKVVISDIGGGIIGISGGTVGIITGAIGTSIVTAVSI